MKEVKLLKCERDNTCYKCDNKDCFNCGDIVCDCLLLKCSEDGNCKKCKYNENTIHKYEVNKQWKEKKL